MSIGIGRVGPQLDSRGEGGPCRVWSCAEASGRVARAVQRLGCAAWWRPGPGLAVRVFHSVSRPRATGRSSGSTAVVAAFGATGLVLCLPDLAAPPVERVRAYPAPRHTYGGVKIANVVDPTWQQLIS